MHIKEFYKEKLQIEPYLYQIRIAELILAGKNVILCVPTGAGKTWASIMPFLLAKAFDLSFPQKMIYSLPLRALTNSIYEDVVKVADASIQTGEYSDDSFFENDIIFSTIDQTLSNFLCFPLALSPRQANINAGAMIGSYLVFDEFHLLDPNLSMNTTIGMLQMLDNLCRFCIMTATLSEGFIEAIKENKVLSNIEVVTLENEDLDRIQSLLPRKDKKSINVLADKIDAKTIIEKHTGQKEKKYKSIVICNRIENAQKVYRDLIKAQKITTNPIFKQARILCLHSRFYDSDRKIIENQLKVLFGKNSSATTNVILVSTAVIEAGMDISCSILHTEASPISSFLQRAGRCARFGGETGEIFIYSILDITEREIISLEPQSKEDREEVRKLNTKYLPYSQKTCEPVYKTLQKYTTLDGDIPKLLIEEILGDSEKRQIETMNNGSFNKGLIVESWNNCQKNMYRETIRDIQSVEVVLVDEAQLEYTAKRPYAFQSIGVFKWTLISWLNKIKKNESIKPFEDGNKLAWNLAENNFIESDEDIKYKLEPIGDFNTITKTVYLNSSYFGYDKTLGLNWEFEESFGKQSLKKERSEEIKTFKPLEKDTFFQHNMGLLGVFQKVFLSSNQKLLDFSFTVLSEYLGSYCISKTDFIKVINWMIILHDYGKLNQKWQLPMQEYQARKKSEANQNLYEALAHTDYNSNEEADVLLLKEIETKFGKRPSHATIGAYVFQEIIENYFDNPYIKACVSNAIAKHHSVDLSKTEFPAFEISQTNYQEMQKLMDMFELNEKLIQKSSAYKIDSLAEFEFEGYEKYILYLFFVRILRLCDQKATENLSDYYTE